MALPVQVSSVHRQAGSTKARWADVDDFLLNFFTSKRLDGQRVPGIMDGDTAHLRNAS